MYTLMSMVFIPRYPGIAVQRSPGIHTVITISALEHFIVNPIRQW